MMKTFPIAALQRDPVDAVMNDAELLRALLSQRAVAVLMLAVRARR